MLRRRLVVFVALALALAACGSPDPSASSDAASDASANGDPDSPTMSTRTALSMQPPEGTPGPRARGQTLYVPCYSHIYFQDDERTLDLASTLTIRNTSVSDSMTVTRVDYFDSDGDLVRQYLDAPRTLGPLASTYFVVRIRDLRGGVGANFIVSWESSRPIDLPFVEVVHITTEATLGISFTSDARVLTQVE